MEPQVHDQFPLSPAISTKGENVMRILIALTSRRTSITIISRMIAGKCSGYHIYDNKEQSPRGFPGMNMKTNEIEENHMGTSLTRHETTNSKYFTCDITIQYFLHVFHVLMYHFKLPGF